MPRRIGAANIDPKAFIRANLPLTQLATVPEIRLHRANASSGLRRLESDDRFGSPYWAYPWAGGLALARHILDHPQIVRGRRVLDYGTGSGLVAIAAAKAGARHVMAADSDAYAVAACGLNATANIVDVVVQGEASLHNIDIVLGGDVFYSAEVAERSIALFDLCHEGGIDVVIGDPWRAYLPLARCRMIAEYDVRDVGSSGQTSKSGVFAFERAAARSARSALGEDAL